MWEKRKGLVDFIELSKRLSEEYTITLIGLSQEQIDTLPQNIKGIERTSSLDELVGYYQNADLYLNLSVEETMGLTTVEAMACGTPCIVYDKTAVPEIVDENSGIVVEASNIDELVHTIESFDFNKFNTDQVRKRAETFSLEKMRNAYMETYR